MILSTGVVYSRGGAWSRGVPGGDPPRTATAAGGTHLTAMHSCFMVDLVYLSPINKVAGS